MSVCCADMMAAKVGPDAKPFVVQPLIEVTEWNVHASALVEV